MAENSFTPITTQEEFDAALGPRLARERSTVTKQFESQISGFQSDIAAREARIAELEKRQEEFDASRKTIEDLQRRVKQYETDSVKTRIARETGLPFDLAGRLQGESEEDIRKDAEALRAIVGQSRTAPLRTDEPGGSPGKGGSQQAALLRLAQDLGPKA